MVQSTINPLSGADGIITYYVSRSYQIKNGVVTKYYASYAMRVGATLYYLLSDHPSTSSGQASAPPA